MAISTDTSTVAPEVTPAEESPPATPPAPRRSWNWRKWRARLVVVLMIAAAVVGGSRLAQSRGDTISRYSLSAVMLTGQAVPVAANQTGQVSAVNVKAQQEVKAGQEVGTIVVRTTTATGKERRTSVRLTAPVNGIVVGTAVPVGSVLPLGEPFVMMYDPTQLTLNTTVPVEDLGRLSAGMVATLRADGLDRPIEAVVQRVEPRVTSSDAGRLPAGQNRLELVLAPRQMADVAGLVPGLRFTGTVDTRSAAGSAPDVLHVTN
jgi:multidrug resistance efflux pump